MKDPLLKTGVAGALLAAICCFTPLLIIALGAVGLSAWLGWLDYVLLPAMVAFAGLAIFALVQRHRAMAKDRGG